jgi:hypothetical protein
VIFWEIPLLYIEIGIGIGMGMGMGQGRLAGILVYKDNF